MTKRLRNNGGLFFCLAEPGIRLIYEKEIFMSQDFVETKASGGVKPISGTNPRHPYEHQRVAIVLIKNILVTIH